MAVTSHLPSRGGGGHSAPTAPDPVDLAYAMPHQTTSHHTSPVHATPLHATPHHIIPAQSSSRQPSPRHTSQGYTMLYDATPLHATSHRPPPPPPHPHPCYLNCHAPAATPPPLAPRPSPPGHFVYSVDGEGRSCEGDWVNLGREEGGPAQLGSGLHGGAANNALKTTHDYGSPKVWAGRRYGQHA